MKVSVLRDAYYEASGKVSDLVRQFDLTGIALIWLLRVGTAAGGLQYSDKLLWPLALFVFSLILDLLQYVYKTIVWGLLNRHYWLKYKDDEKDVPISEKWNLAPTVCLILKTAACFSAYLLLLIFIFSQVRKPSI